MFQVRRSSKIKPPTRGSNAERSHARESRSVERKSKIPVCGAGSVPRSKSQAGGFYTPLSSVQPTPSRAHVTPSFSLNTAPVKDTRNLQDREYVALLSARVKQYFQQNCPDVLVNGLEIKPMTSNMFVKMINHLFETLNITHKNQPLRFDKSDFVKELPRWMKDLNYPGSLKSWIQTVNVPHSWPHVVALISWLVSLIEVSSAYDPQTNIMMPTTTEQEFVKLSLQTYSMFVAGEEEQRQVHVAGFACKMFSQAGIDEEDMSVLHAQREKLVEDIKHSEEEHSVKDEYDEVSQRLNVANTQYQKAIEDCEKIDREISETKEDTGKIQKKINLVEKETEARRGQKELIHRALSEQTMSIEEQAEIRKKCDFQEKQNKLLEKEIDDYNNMKIKNEVYLSDIRDKVLQGRHVYNRNVIQLKQKVSEISSLNVQKDHAPTEALEESKQMLQSCAKLITQYKNKHIRQEMDLVDRISLVETIKKEIKNCGEQEADIRNKTRTLKKENEALAALLEEIAKSRNMKDEEIEARIKEAQEELVNFDKLQLQLAESEEMVKKQDEAVQLLKKMEDDFWKELKEYYAAEYKKWDEFAQKLAAKDQSVQHKVQDLINKTIKELEEFEISIR